jgi:hypothetical protein
MLMTRIHYLTFTLILVALNAAALWAMSGSLVGVNRVVPAAFIINALGGLWLWSTLAELAKSAALSICTASVPG